jgi:hypothetical protein
MLMKGKEYPLFGRDIGSDEKPSSRKYGSKVASCK